MLQVNYKLLPKKQKKEKSVGVKSVPNSFYTLESHHEPYLSEYHEVYVDDFFGLRFSTEDHEVGPKANHRPLQKSAEKAHGVSPWECQSID